MYQALLFLPALGSIVAGLLGRKWVLSKSFNYLTCLVLSALLSLVAFTKLDFVIAPFLLFI
jgi:hypothetical protein